MSKQIASSDKNCYNHLRVKLYEATFFRRQNLCQMAIHVISQNSGNPFTKSSICHGHWKLLHFSPISTICIENNNSNPTIKKNTQTIGHRIETKGNGDRSDRWKFKVEWQKTTTMSGGKKEHEKFQRNGQKQYEQQKWKKKIFILKREEKKRIKNCTRLQTLSVLVPEIHTCIIKMKPRFCMCFGPKTW